MKKIMIVLIAVLLTGCAETPEKYEKALKVCSNFGGLEYHYLFPWESWACKDGTNF